MKYAEVTTLFNLHTIDYKALTKKIWNSKKSYTINLTRLEPFLKLIQSESKIVNKVDIPVNFVFNISADTYPTVTIKIEHINNDTKNINILSHISNKSDTLYFDMSLNDFNRHDLTPEEMFERLCYNYSGLKDEGVSCSWLTAHMLQMIKKVDTLLKYDKNVYNLVKKNGIYVEKHKLSHECFDINISAKEFTIESKAKHLVVNPQSVFSIHIDLFSGRTLSDMRITLQMYNQSIKLTYDEFVRAELTDIEKMITTFFKIKNVHVSDMDNLKSELVLHDMMVI